MKEVIGIFFLCCLCHSGMSQSYITRKAYFAEPVLINPALCGADYVSKVTLAYNRQWINIPQAPASFFVSGELRLGKFDFYDPKMFVNHSKFKSLERVGVGAGLYSDVNGPFQELDLLLTYSYHLALNENTGLSFGITGKVGHFGVNRSELDPRDVDDPVIDFENHTTVNTNAGAYLHAPQYFAGFSVTDIFRTKAENMVYPGSSQGFYVMGGYRFKNQNTSMILEPSVTWKYYPENKTMVRLDYHAKLYFSKYGWAGFSYIDGDQFEFIAAVRILRSYYIAYRFVSVQRGLNDFTKNDHGIMLAKNLGVNRNTAVTY